MPASARGSVDNSGSNTIFAGSGIGCLGGKRLSTRIFLLGCSAQACLRVFWQFSKCMESEAAHTPNKGEILVFFIRKETKCAECGEELFRGSVITLDQDKGALCLVCADLDHLEYLPRGDAALTRRA